MSAQENVTANETQERPERERGTGRIFQRPKSPFWWIAYTRRGKETRESAKSADYRKAEKLLRYRLKEIGAEQLGARPFAGPAAERITVGELLEALEADLTLKGKMGPTVTSHLKPIRAAFEDLAALAVTAERIDKYIQEQLAPRQEGAETIPGKAAATVNRGTQLLGQAFRLAVKRGRLPFLPPVRHLSEVGNVRRGFFERAEFEAVVNALPDDYVRDFCRFAYHTGWRKGEISALRWADVDGEAVRLRGEDSKNRQGRSVPLEGELAAIIKRRRAARQYETEAGTVALAAFVFHRGDGEPIREFRKSWATACKAAGVAGRLFHDLRRTAARNLVRAGAPETVAMAVTGHKTRAVFQRYAIASERDVREALARTQALTAQEAPRAAVLPVKVAKARAAHAAQ